jgi:hypothetical protein
MHSEAPSPGYRSSGMSRAVGMPAINLATEVDDVFFLRK